MSDSLLDNLRVDRTTFRVTTFKDAAREDRALWLSKTPIERLRHVELLRELNYGPEVINQGLQRVLTVFERPRR